MVKRILIVDDESDYLNLMSLSLKKNGYEIFIALDGEAAVEAVKEKKPDLILLDVKMPGMNGHETLERIRKVRSGLDIPIIFLTADSRYRSAEDVAHLSAQGYFLKPFDSKELLSKIRQCLG